MKKKRYTILGILRNKKVKQLPVVYSHLNFEREILGRKYPSVGLRKKIV